MSTKNRDLQAKDMPWLQPQRVKVHHVKNARFLGAWHSISTGQAGQQWLREQRVKEIAEAKRAEELKQQVEQTEQPETQD